MKVATMTALFLVCTGAIATFSTSASAHSLKTRNSQFVTPKLAADQPTPGKVLYYGGPVLSHVKVYVVFWGPSVDPQTVQGMGGFYSAITASSLLDWLNQYGTNIPGVGGHEGSHQSIGRGSYGGSFTITPHNVAQQMTNDQVAAELESQIDQGTLPVPNADSLYMVYFPKGIVLTLADGSASCQAWCGDHEGYNSKKYGLIAYAMMPDLSEGTGCDYGCSIGETSFDSMTVISSHELSEAITDPLCPPMGQPNGFPEAWMSSDQQEIGDLCAQETLTKLSPSSTTSTTYAIQQEWDNGKGVCSAGPWSPAGN